MTWCFDAVFCFSRVDFPPTVSYLKSFVKIRDVVKIAILQNWELWPKCSLIDSPYRMGCIRGKPGVQEGSKEGRGGSTEGPSMAICSIVPLLLYF